MSPNKHKQAQTSTKQARTSTKHTNECEWKPNERAQMNGGTSANEHKQARMKAERHMNPNEHEPAATSMRASQYNRAGTNEQGHTGTSKQRWARTSSDGHERAVTSANEGRQGPASTTEWGKQGRVNEWGWAQMRAGEHKWGLTRASQHNRVGNEQGQTGMRPKCSPPPAALSFPFVCCLFYFALSYLLSISLPTSKFVCAVF